MTIREILERDRDEWVRLREALWPGSLSDHDAETKTHFEQPHSAAIFVAESDGRLIGFLELDYRPYAPACRSSPVPFIEGWYVEPGLEGEPDAIVWLSPHGIERVMLQPTGPTSTASPGPGASASPSASK